MPSRTFSLALAAFLLLSSVAVIPASAQSVAPRDGWVVIDTEMSFPDLVDRTRTAIAEAKMGLVTQASASDGARGQGITIPGNRVIGVYRNDYARRMLDASIAAGIEAPIRFYLTENPDQTATLSYKTPSFVFAPYMDEGGEELKALATELDGVFQAIAADATGKSAGK
ncbi:DUF302 domain-containing protein [Amorphus orientalis]|uniref:Uncharacterized protein (DUF302 family) n=1 Tax=Amorphus orientalis TaxID=649198 RepID=A0AAE3VRH1_9HYPH|nr:DUF302 domain-containing protein [Amorphus orientalis]MDQ0316495.1 uncharacterized protein (DUF302 family) [Amorphus orientalis]